MPDETVIVEEPKKTEVVEEPKKEASPALDHETLKKIEFYDQINDPTTGPQIIEFLHDKFVKRATETGRSAKEVANDFKQNLLAKTPKEYQFLVEAIAPALESTVESLVEAKVTPLRDDFKKQIETQVNTTVASEIEHFQKEMKLKGNDDPIWKEMEKLQKQMPWSGEGDIQSYLGNLYVIASRDNLETNIVRKTVDRINKNATDIKTMSSEVSEARVTRGSKLPTLNEAVAAAMRGERFE